MLVFFFKCFNQMTFFITCIRLRSSTSFSASFSLWSCLVNISSAVNDAQHLNQTLLKRTKKFQTFLIYLTMYFVKVVNWSPSFFCVLIKFSVGVRVDSRCSRPSRDIFDWLGAKSIRISISQCTIFESSWRLLERKE